MLAAEAHAAARAAMDPAAVAAARAAGHAVAVAHMASHAVGAPAYAILAIKLSEPDNAPPAAEFFTWAVQSPDIRDVL